ncbi:MAG TPA: SPOR domain-containing protein [Stellaceae bacterium]|nr:SPOR domain-containing protein [Stellaceae bacterium]
MAKHSPAGSLATAVSAFALVIGLAACAGGPGNTSADAGTATLMKVADETAAGGDPATAANLYRQVHEQAPKDPVPLAKMGAMLLALQEPAAAAQAYRAAVALAPQDPELHRGLALALLSSDQADAAAAEIRIALEKRAGDARLYNLLGVANDMAGHHALAQQSYAKGLELDPASVGLRNNVALSMALSGDYKGAIDRLTQIVGPEAPPRYRLNLAMAYALAGDDDKAAATAREVLDEKSVRNNLAFYTLLRGMDEKHRTAAILGAEMHGGAISSADIAAAQAALETARADTPAAAPVPSVSVADAPPITAPAAPAPRPPKAAAEPKTAPYRVALAQPDRAVAMAPRPAEPHEPAADALVSPAPATAPPMMLTPQASPPAQATADATPAPQPQAAPPSTPAAPEPAPEQVKAEPPAPAADPAPQQLAASDPAPAQATPDPAPQPPAADPTPLAKADPAPAPATEPAPRQLAKSDPAPAPRGAHGVVERYVVQLGSWLSEPMAKKIAATFNAGGVAVSVSHFSDHDGRTWFVVRSADVATADEANALKDTIKAAAPGDVSPVVVRVRTSHPSSPNPA